MQKRKIEKYHFLKNEPKKRQFEIYDLADYLKTNSDYSSKPHTHSFYQIIWFKSNKGTHHIDFEHFDVSENRIFFIAKNQVHYFEKRSDYLGSLIHFNESFLLSNETDIDFFLNYSIFNNKSEPYFQITKELQPKIASYFSQIKEETVHIAEFGNSIILSNLLKALLLVIEREKRKISETNNKSDNSKYLKFRDLLENNFHKNWSVSKYANALSISTKTLNNSFPNNCRKDYP